MLNQVIIDTNIIARFVLRDNDKLSPKALAIFRRAASSEIILYLDEMVIAETIWLMGSFYERPREFIASNLLKLVRQKWIVNPRKSLILAALELYQKSNFSYIDCWLYILSKEKRLKLETFDNKLQKMKE